MWMVVWWEKCLFQTQTAAFVTVIYPAPQWDEAKLISFWKRMDNQKNKYQNKNKAKPLSVHKLQCDTATQKNSLSISSKYSKCPCSILSHIWQHETLLSFCSHVKRTTHNAQLHICAWVRQRARETCGVGGRTRCAMWSWPAVWEMKRETTQWQCSAIEREGSQPLCTKLSISVGVSAAPQSALCSQIL